MFMTTRANCIKVKRFLAIRKDITSFHSDGVLRERWGEGPHIHYLVSDRKPLFLKMGCLNFELSLVSFLCFRR